MLAPLYLGVVTVFVIDDVVADGGPDLMFAALAFVAGIASLVVPAVVGPPLDGTSQERLLGTYRTRFMLRMAFTEAPLFVGLALSFAAQEWLPFLVGAGFTVVGLARLAPSDRNIAKDQELLYQQGSPCDLRSVLRQGPG